MEKDFRWDLSKFCTSIDDCKNKIEKIMEKAIELNRFNNKLSDPKLFKDFLVERQCLQNDFWISYIYAKASLDVEFDNADFQKLVNYAENKLTLFNQMLAPFDVEIKNLGVEYLESLKSDDDFSQWINFLDDLILQNKHILSETEEKMLSEISKLQAGFKSVNENCFFSDIKYASIEDSKGNVIEVKTGNIPKLRQSKDRVVRKNVAKSVVDAYVNYGSLMSQNFISYLNSIITITKLRKYDSVLQRQLQAYYLNESVYKSVIKFAKDFQKDVEIPYYKCKKKLLNYDVFYSYDIHAPVETNEKTYSFLEGVEIVKKAVSVLGQDYVNLVQQAVSERWIDVYPRDKKRSGGYTWGPYGVTNIVLINWNDDLDSVFTLAHELGHAIHHYTMDKNQEMQNSDVPIFMAEVASTFNENLLFNYMYDNAKTFEEKFSLLNYQMRNIVGTVFSQCSMSEFEDFCYKTLEGGQPLGKDVLEEMWYQIVAKPFNEVVDYTLFNKLGWQNVWHFYNLSYYVWQYALAFMISSVFAKSVLENEKDAVENYFNFLRGGKQEKPTELLKRLGIDIESEQFYKSSFENFKNVALQFEKATDEFIKNRNNG